MKNTRKILTSLAVAAGLAAGTALVYAAPPAGFGPGSAGCAFGAGPASWGGGPMGPGMMGGGHGPGMMGYGPGPRGGHGPGMMGYGPGPRGGSGPGAGAAPAVNIEERVNARLSFLKDQIKITADQQKAWDAYAAQVKTQAATMQAFHATPPGAVQTPAEGIEQRANRATLRAEQLKAMSAAVKDLYAALTPEQKTVADRHFGGQRLSQGPRGYGRWN